MSTTPEEQDEAQVRPFSEFLIQQANGRTHDEPEDVLRAAFADVVGEVQTRTSMNVLYGTPPSAVRS